MKTFNQFHIARILGTILLFAVAHINFGQTPDQLDVRALKIGEIIERPLKGGETHFYTIELKQGQVLRVDVQEKNIDLKIGLFRIADKQVVAQMDFGSGNDREVMTNAIEQNGVYAVIVAAWQSDLKGTYQLNGNVKETAAADLEQIKAERSLAKGLVKRRQKTAAFLREAITEGEEALSLWKSLGEKYWEDKAAAFLGGVYDDLGEKQKALEFYNQALLLRRQIGDKQGEARMLANIGLTFDELGEKQKAIEYLKQALLLRRQIGDKSGEATSLRNVGAVYDDLGEKQKAIEYLDQALLLFRQIGEQSGEAKTLNSIASVYADIGGKQKALEYLNQSLLLRRQIGDKSGEATTLNNIGFVYSDLGEKQKALEFFKLSLPLDKNNQMATLNNIGKVYSDLGEKQKALEFYNQALSLYRQANDKSGEATALNNIGSVYSDLGEKQKALDFFNQSLPLYTQVGDKQGEATTLTNIGAIYNLFGDKRKALELYNQSFLVFKQIGDRSNEATTLNNLGKVYSDLGEQQKALEFFNQSLLLHRQIEGKSDEATALNNIGGVYSSLGDKQKALEFYNQALLVYKKVGKKSGEALMLANIGSIYLSFEEQQKALEFFNQSLSLRRQVGDKRGEAVTLAGIAKVHYDLGEQQKALEFFNQSLSLFKQVGDKSGESTTLNDIGIILDDSGEQQKALELYSKSLIINRQISGKSGEAITLSNMMSLWESLRNLRIAVFYGKQSINKFQELRQNIKGLDKKVQNTYLKSVEPAYRQLADLLISQGRIAEAEQVLDMLKEEEYFSYLRRDDKAAADLKSRLTLSADEKKAFDDYEKFAGDITRAAEEYEALKKKIPFGGTAESLGADERKRHGELELQYNAAVTVFNKFLDDLKVKFGKENTAVAKIESDTIGLLKKLNQPRTVIISTIVGEDRLNLIVTTSDVQKAHTVDIKAADLNKLVADFRETVKNPNLDPRSLGKRLYDKLFPAALQKDLENIKPDTIVWSLDGTLRYVPMSALWDGEKYLVERYNQAVITLASRDKLETSVNSNRKNWIAFGVGVSKPFESFNPLPAVPKELCSVVKDAKQSAFCRTLGENGVFRGVMLRDEEFTFDIFKQNLGKTPIVHIASHFALNPGEYDQSYLLLGGGANRKFSLVDVRNTRLDGIELLTLSACNTAMTSGNASNGLEVEGFGALAQNQGVKSVLATLWAVADDSTGKLMTDFYKILETDPSTGKAEAMRNAQINLIKGANQPEQFTETRRSEIVRIGANATDQPKFVKDANAPFAHPYFWSPFVLIGNWK